MSPPAIAEGLKILRRACPERYQILHFLQNDGERRAQNDSFSERHFRDCTLVPQHPLDEFPGLFTDTIPLRPGNNTTAGRRSEKFPFGSLYAILGKKR
jgi:hypothetical protein